MKPLNMLVSPEGPLPYGETTRLHLTVGADTSSYEVPSVLCTDEEGFSYSFTPTVVDAPTGQYYVDLVMTGASTWTRPSDEATHAGPNLGEILMQLVLQHKSGSVVLLKFISPPWSRVLTNGIVWA